MIVIGSQALVMQGLPPQRPVQDLDLVGEEADIARLRAALGDAIAQERSEHGHRHVFHLREGEAFARIEIDYEGSPAWRMLPALCRDRAQVLGLDVLVPPLEVLYLLKRATAIRPIHFEKTLADLLHIKPKIGAFDAAQTAFYRAFRQEGADRYRAERHRFSLAITEEVLREKASGARFYEYDDLRRAVAHTPGQPLIDRCRKGSSIGAIDPTRFAELSPEDRLRLAQEEIMVVAIERFHLRDASLAPATCYARAAIKSMRELFTGALQDFCIDHAEVLLGAVPHDFIQRFTEALERGELREVEITARPPSEEHRRIWDLLERGQLNAARPLAEDLVLRADHGTDPQAWFLLGVTLGRSGQHQRALACLTRAIADDRKNAIAWFHVGLSSAAIGQGGNAVKALKQALALGLRTPELYWQLGLALEGEANLVEAAGAFRHAQRLQPDMPGLTAKLEALAAST